MKTVKMLLHAMLFTALTLLSFIAYAQTPAPELQATVTWTLTDIGEPEEADYFVLYQVIDGKNIEVGRADAPPIAIVIPGGSYGHRYFFLTAVNVMGQAYSELFRAGYFPEESELPTWVIDVDPLPPNTPILTVRLEVVLVTPAP